MSNTCHLLVRLSTALVIAVVFAIGCQKTSETQRAKPTKANTNSPTVELFKSPLLKQWESINFGHANDHEFNEQVIRVNHGYQLSGVRFTGDAVPDNNYRLEFQAQKETGTDFFCGLTIPVHKQFCTFVVGGWGGTVTGISCVDGKDASDNSTTTVRKYNKSQWYKIRVDVSDDKLQCWIDDEQVVDLDLQSVKLSLRTDVEQCKPVSLCTFATTGVWKDMTVTRLPK